MAGWICKSCGNRIFEDEPDEHNEDCPAQLVLVRPVRVENIETERIHGGLDLLG
jgi:hypothetical protein